MNKVKKIGAILGIKGVLSIASLATIAVALVVYTVAVTITPTQQLTVGASSASWDVYINELNEVRYLPGGHSEPTFDSGDTATYAFNVVTDSSKVCAIKIDLTSEMDDTRFSNFDITVYSWTGSAWASATLYNSNTGTTTITEIDGLSAGASGYLHQSAGSNVYYMVKVTYSYDLVDTTTLITATFRYTPLAQDDFTP
jgi:hypothetical protein